MGTMALVPQVVDAVNFPVVAAGGIADGLGLDHQKVKRSGEPKPPLRIHRIMYR